jgi:hypothetical protein
VRAFLTLLTFAGSLQLMAGFAFVAAAFQRAGSSAADPIGFTGIGISFTLFVVLTAIIWTRDWN